MVCSLNKKQETAAAAPNIPVPSSTRAVVLQDYVSAEYALDLWPSPAGTKNSRFPIQSQRTRYFKSNKNEQDDMSALLLGTPFPTYAALGRVAQIGGGKGRGHYKKDKARPRKEIPGVNISAYLGALGISGRTAYFALMGVLKPEESDTLALSGATGVIGNVAIQYAKKVLGLARVIGIAGTDEKCTWLKSIGADEAVNYKSTTFAQDLTKAIPYKKNLPISQVMSKVNEPVVMNNYAQILLNRLILEGFTVNDYLDLMGEVEQAPGAVLCLGKLILHGAEMVVDIQGRLEEIPRVWGGLFAGVNTGKLVTKVAD
ncbi:NAD-binding protein [Fomitiporia mediterranea MF3/22]|uniref:NAD-binding protein n=1 Tax=Fomitiporia mediterranea (strain MF3/22) TaxID=694068 RepID=UPI000440936D|nr:NAD-binding protein [Fomitiporia mediterranea MF3/22]EJD03065.1 NAD-binding protein [Fomitiporia mediterranea MF3/22]